MPMATTTARITISKRNGESRITKSMASQAIAARVTMKKTILAAFSFSIIQSAA